MKAENPSAKYGWRAEYNHHYEGLLPFKYKPLENDRNIRLLQLHKHTGLSEFAAKSGTPTSDRLIGPNTTRVRIRRNPDPDDLTFWPLEVTLVEVPLDKLPPFQSISYVCGPQEQRAIICNGRLLFINRNCALALYHLSCDLEDSENGYIWVDQICIHQDDAAEKGQQVALMAEHYSCSSRTAAWIGESDEELEELFDTHNKPTTAMLIGHGNGLPFQREGIAKLFSNPWFRRGWIVQEAGLSRELELFCGSYVISWGTLLDFYRESLVWPRWSLPDRETIYRFNQLRRTIIHSETRSLNIRQALEFTHQTSVTDQRDRLYALFGVCRPIRELVGFPDYTITSEELYLKFVFAVIKQYVPNSPFLWQMITIYGNGPDDTERLPSWAPDFSHGKSKCLVHPLCRMSDFETSSRFTPSALPTQQFDEELRTLTCQCVDIGTLGHILWDRPSDLHHTLIEDPRAVQRILDANEIHEYDMSGQGRPVRVNPARPTDLLYRLVEDDYFDSAKKLPFHNAAEWQDMKVFVTARDASLAVAPACAHEGDKVVLFEGNIPTGQLSVLHGNGDGLWKYTGTCFLLGWKPHGSRKIVDESGTCEVSLR
ncbi:uncharacterized protein Z519_00976 [Cladophialophora bantiana CBS 173.52]|uniref:Heterokaryon incompatibility domain-containing protein n=1 Tax=Cladophialophora bantiana (strain ATCC 10958 / CBS 173.52 / CDC B-1940 / NIH 8579) TaxID=1442370 RepID=A0A0D2I0Q6_CLAB1|nr:uncharacterized protein Z519_00976 [Cladophialophora bantiana CBS 173.52]KIW99313.1 hypothetical protein Z519_00976 [Cladophialophora bantiana CBS 173.52]